MIASREPSAEISETAWETSSSLANSCPTSSSASSTFGETEVRFGLHRLAQGFAVGVDHGDHVEALELSDERRVQVGLDPPRQRAREHHDRGAPGEVHELVLEQFDLALGHLGAAFVDLGLLAGGGIEHRGIGPRLVADADEVVEDRLLGQLLDDVGPGRPAGEAGGDHRLAEAFRVRAMLTPLPPAAVRCSTVLWRRPGLKFGTASDLSIAALSVTVMIIFGRYPPCASAHSLCPRARDNRLANRAGLSSGLFRECPRLLAQTLGSGPGRVRRLAAARGGRWRCCARRSPGHRRVRARRRPRAATPPRPGRRPRAAGRAPTPASARGAGAIRAAAPITAPTSLRPAAPAPPAPSCWTISARRSHRGLPSASSRSSTSRAPGLEVRTSRSTPAPAPRAAVRNGSTASRPIVGGLMVAMLGARQLHRARAPSDDGQRHYVAAVASPSPSTSTSPVARHHLHAPTTFGLLPGDHSHGRLDIPDLTYVPPHDGKKPNSAWR